MRRPLRARLALLLLAQLPLLLVRAGGAASAAERGLARFERWYAEAGGVWAPGVAAVAAAPACADARAARAEVRVVTRARVARETVRRARSARKRAQAREMNALSLIT